MYRLEREIVKRKAIARIAIFGGLLTIQVRTSTLFETVRHPLHPVDTVDLLFSNSLLVEDLIVDDDYCNRSVPSRTGILRLLHSPSLDDPIAERCDSS